MLREEDRKFMDRKGWNWEAKKITFPNRVSETHVIVHDYRLPSKYFPDTVDLLARVLRGYPEVGLDMFWTRPHVVLITGATPHAADRFEWHGNLLWQRWSRHLNDWRPEVDNFETFFASIAIGLKK